VNTPPKQIGGADLLLFTPIDQRHRPTGNCQHFVNDVRQGPAVNLAICTYSGEPGYYLFSCDEEWAVITDSWHETLDGAMSQAEFEYDGVNATWQPLSR
jgi:hypothetical protein